MNITQEGEEQYKMKNYPLTKEEFLDFCKIIEKTKSKEERVWYTLKELKEYQKLTGLKD